jgi:Cu/Ag efflux protein CusF
MNPSKLIVAAALAAAACPVMAQPETHVDMASGVGAVMATGTVKATATVVAIDAATRTVSLKNKQGKVTDLQVGEDVRNFEQLRVGDLVTVEYKEALSVSLNRQSGLRSSTERQIEDRAAPGAKPGGMVGREVTVTADVVAVNARTGMVTLKGPRGRTVDVHVEDPRQLKAVRRGDQVQAVYTEALAVSVTPRNAR